MTNHADPHSIEAGIEADRASLASTLSELQDRVSVENIAKDAMSMIRTNAASYSRTVDDLVRSNPLALGVIGVGVAWLLMGPRRSSRAEPIRSQTSRWEDEGGVPTDADDDHAWSRQADQYRATANRSMRDLDSQARSTKSAIGSAMASGMETVRDFAAEKAKTVSDFTSNLRDSLVHGLEDMTDSARGPIVAAREKAYAARVAAERAMGQPAKAAGRLVDDNPMIAAGLAMALGAVVAAALPRSRMEDELFGTESDRLMSDAARVLRDERSRAMRVMQGVGDEIKGSVREMVSDVSERATGVADRVTNRAMAEASDDVAGNDPQSWHDSTPRTQL